MKRLIPFLAAAALACAAFALDGPATLGAVFLPVLLLVVLGAIGLVSASRPDPLPMPRNARRLPHWLAVALYRLECFAFDLRDKLGAWIDAGMFRSGLALRVFPGTVTADIGFGVIGSPAFDGPMRSQPARINHGTAADIVVGRWFTLAADGTARPGGAGAIGGVLAMPKSYASPGTAAGGPLAPTLTLQTGTIGEFVYMGNIIVSLGAAVALGAPAKYNDVTGVILSGAPGAGETAIPNSKFIRYANAAAGLAVLELTN